MIGSRSIRPLVQIAALAVCVVLAGCMTTPPSSMAKLSRLSPLEADPAAIRLAVQLPEPLIVRGGDVRLRISFDGGTDASRLVEEYAAILSADPPAMPGLLNQPDDGARIFVAALSEEDAQSLARVQRRIGDWRAAGIEGKGQLSISASACADGPPPDGPLHVTSWMQTAPDVPFFVLVRRADLRKMVARAGAPAGGVPRCNAQSGRG